MSYIVKLEQFEGPLDLLLYLIQREEMDIYNIPIARITEQYLKQIEQLEQLDLQSAGDFVVMAATLMRIKARLLLPVQRPDEEGEEDPRKELVQRLLEYKKFKEAAKRLEDHENERRLRYTRPLDQDLLHEVQRMGEEELFEVSMPQLIKALQSVLARVDEVVTHEVELESVSLEEKRALLYTRLSEQKRLLFVDLFAKDRTRLEVIVTFMALLEMVKRGEARTHQKDNDSELWIFSAQTEKDAVQEGSA